MKIPCSTCGALILHTTAQATGGLCMPCKNGTRLQIEASKAHHAAQKLPDPFRDLWTDLVRRVHHTPEGLSRFSRAELTCYALDILLGSVPRSGLYGYFDTHGETHSTALTGLKSLGASRPLALLEQAARLLFLNGQVPAESATRARVIVPYPEDDTTDPTFVALFRLEDELLPHLEALQPHLEAYARRHHLISDLD